MCAMMLAFHLLTFEQIPSRPCWSSLLVLSFSGFSTNRPWTSRFLVPELSLLLVPASSEELTLLELGAGGSVSGAADPAKLASAREPVEAGPNARDADGLERDSMGLCGGGAGGGMGASSFCLPPNLLVPTEPWLIGGLEVFSGTQNPLAWWAR